MTTKPVLTEDQAAAADQFFHFLMGDAKTFVLSGGAGVGKTFLMQHISKTVMAEYEAACRLLDTKPQYETLIFTATTNKAAEVLEKSLGVDVHTIHSYLGLKVKEDYRTGKTNLEKTASWKVRSNMLVFIDEYSMIDTVLNDIIKESFTNSKIVFIGDHAQMAPVNEEISPVYKEVDLDNFVFLGKPVRNAGSPALMALCSQLRETVETGVFRPIEHVPGSVEYLSDQQMMQKLDDVFVGQEPSSRILCYTNTRVEHFNNYIREIRGLPEHMLPGDVMVTANTYSRGPLTLNVEREMEILRIGDEAHEAGYGELFADGEPVAYVNVDIRTPLGNEVKVQVPHNKERWQLAIKEMASRKRWGDYFDLKNLCCDLRFKTACTVYKSQGSTYDSVFLDLGNIGTSWDAKQVARMLYVGASRASSNVYLFGSLPARYVGERKLCLSA